MTDKDVAARDTTYGVFSVGDHRFAIAAAALGQVMPIQTLTDFPGVGPDVLGVIDWRGTLTPVLDVLRLCSFPTRQDTPAAALAVRRGDHVVALGIDDVAGLTKIKPDEVQDLSHGDDTSIARKLWVRGMDYVTLLDTDRFFDVKTIPRARFVAAKQRRDRGLKGAEPHLTFLCGDVRYAIGVGSLFNTVPRRALDAQSLATELFSGMVDYLDRSIPVVNTNVVLGLPTAKTRAEREIVVVHAKQDRLLGLAVDQILNIEYFPTDSIRPIAAHVRTALPCVRASVDVSAPDQGVGSSAPAQTLILDVDAVTAIPQLDELADLSQKTKSSRPDRMADFNDGFIRDRILNLIFQAGNQYGTPLSSIVNITAPPKEVVPWQAPVPGMEGFFFYENQMIPLITLRDYLGLPEVDGAAEPRVVVSGSGEELCGFLVDRLLAIKASDWHTEDQMDQNRGDDVIHVRGRAGGEMITRIDLWKTTQGITRALAPAMV